MVLSEVAQLMMTSGASTCPAECERAATSRLTEVATTTVPAGHRRPVEKRAGISQDMIRPSLPVPNQNDVPSTQTQWKITAIFRTMATFALFMPIRLASFIPQALKDDHFFVR